MASMNNITAGVCERQDANRTRETGRLDEPRLCGLPLYTRAWSVNLYLFDRLRYVCARSL